MITLRLDRSSVKKNTKRILIPSEEEKLQMFPMDFSKTPQLPKSIRHLLP